MENDPLRKVYICSPYSGDTVHNANMARVYCRQAMDEGFIPIAPHIYFTQFLFDDVEEERRKGMDAGLGLLLECEQVWVFGEPTEGMREEIEHARRNGIPVVEKQ